MDIYLVDKGNDDVDVNCHHDAVLKDGKSVGDNNNDTGDGAMSSPPPLNIVRLEDTDVVPPLVTPSSDTVELLPDAEPVILPTLSRQCILKQKSQRRWCLTTRSSGTSVLFTSPTPTAM